VLPEPAEAPHTFDITPITETAVKH
jgi:hypothetical protein